jgi:Ras-related protein Rab-7A
MEKKYSFLKILIIGESGVGKTSILNQVVQGEYEENIESSLGTDYQIKIFKDVSAKKIRVQFWDIIGFKTNLLG